MIHEPDGSRRWRTIQVAARNFQNRMNEAVIDNGGMDTSKSASVYSRLALIHAVAKRYAVEAVENEANPNPDVEIDELTDPPLYGSEADGLVRITFSYAG